MLWVRDCRVYIQYVSSRGVNKVLQEPIGGALPSWGLDKGSKEAASEWGGRDRVSTDGEKHILDYRAAWIVYKKFIVCSGRAWVIGGH